MMPLPQARRLAFLQRERALGLLDDAGEEQLRTLEAGASDLHDEYELAATAVLLAALPPLEPLPLGLHDRLRRTLSGPPDSAAH